MPSEEIYRHTDENDGSTLRMIARDNHLKVRTTGDPVQFLDPVDVIRLRDTLTELISERGWMDPAAAPQKGDRVTMLYPGGEGHPETTRESVIKYVGLDGSMGVYCVERCGACGKGRGEGTHRVGMFGSRIVPSPPASERNCLCDSPAECAKAFPVRCPFF